MGGLRKYRRAIARYKGISWDKATWPGKRAADPRNYRRQKAHARRVMRMEKFLPGTSFFRWLMGAFQDKGKRR